MEEARCPYCHKKVKFELNDNENYIWCPFCTELSQIYVDEFNEFKLRIPL